MRSTAIVGLAPIVLGLAALAYQGINYTTGETVIDVGPLHTTAERHRTLPRPPALGAVVVVRGVVLLIAGMRKHATHEGPNTRHAGSGGGLRCSL